MTTNAESPTTNWRESLFRWPQRLLTAALVVAAVTWALAWRQRGSLPYAREILGDLAQAPVQQATTRETFSFDYRGTSYNVTPMAEYELWGLVVSHNDINAFSDIYHDRDSVDVKDLCVIWGANVQTNDFRKVEYKSDCYVCRFRYRQGVNFNHSELANTHLISSDPRVRRTIGRVRVADQVHLRGLLVNYGVAGTDWERKSSLTRDDSGMGACEVMFVESIEIVQPGTPGWYALGNGARLLLWVLLGAKLGLFIIKAIWDQRDYQQRIAATTTY